MHPIQKHKESNVLSIVITYQTISGCLYQFNFFNFEKIANLKRCYALILHDITFTIEYFQYSNMYIVIDSCCPKFLAFISQTFRKHLYLL